MIDSVRARVETTLMMRSGAPVTESRGFPVQARRAAPAFTLLDVLVSIAVIAVLVGLLLPSLSTVNETARRVACQSNVRQIGLGLVMYADDWRGTLPPSVFLPPPGAPVGAQARGTAQPQEMQTVRVPGPGGASVWDGLGLLYGGAYLSTPKVFYCPSHHGANPYARYAMAWDEGTQAVIANYHYRGEGPIGHRASGKEVQRTTRSLYLIDPARSALIADGLRDRSDYNHRVGVNFFRADLSVHWYNDHDQKLMDGASVGDDDTAFYPVKDAWDRLDGSVANN